MRRRSQRENIGHFGSVLIATRTSRRRSGAIPISSSIGCALRERASLPSYARRIVPTIDAVGETAVRPRGRLRRPSGGGAHQAGAVHDETRGEEYEGFVTGVTGFGLFVRLGGLGVEGMVRVVDWRRLLPTRRAERRIVGRRTRRTFRMGDKIRVESRARIPRRERSTSSCPRNRPEGAGGRRGA
jgi:ribonuclease R